MAVKLSGAVLASLLYDNSSSSGDQYGFLIGESVDQVKDTISDSQINNVQVETNIYVFESVPCQREMFCNSSSELTIQNVVNLLPRKHQNIIGWYSFRRNSTLRPSYRERLFHCKLASLTSQHTNSLIFFLCSAKASSNKSTHTLDHSFLHLENNVFKKLTLDVINLGDTTHTDYLTIPRHTVASHQGALSKLIHQQEREFLNSQGHVETKRIQNLNKAITKQLQQISKDVTEGESRCNELEMEVSRLRSRAKLKMLEIQQETMNHRHRPITQATRGPSVDDILCMDETDEARTEALMDHVSTSISTQDHISTSISTPDDTISDLHTRCDSDDMETETVQLKLIGANSVPSQQMYEDTDKLPTHKRSSSNPREGEKGALRRSRSKSKEQVMDATSLQGQNKVKQNNDPFSYVGDILAAESKRGSTVKSNDVLRNDLTGHDSRRKFHIKGHAKESRVHSASTRSHKLNSDNSVSPRRGGSSGNQNSTENETSNTGSRTNHSAMNSNMSSDEEMELTSSPVY